MRKAKTTIYLIALSIYLGFTILNSSFFAPITDSFVKYAIILCLILLLFKELLGIKPKVREVVYLLLTLLLTAIIYLNLGWANAILPLFFFIYAARDVPLSKILRLAFLESAILLAGIIICAKLGIITDYIEIGARTRDYLGFRYSLFPQVLLFNITALDIYIHRQKFTKLRASFWLIVNFLMFTFTDSRLAFALAIFLILGSYFITHHSKFIAKRKLLQLLAAASFIICSCVSIAATINYNPLTQSELNDFLGNRLSLGQNALSEYGINLIGHSDIVLVGNGLTVEGTKAIGVYNYVDSLYVILLLRYGIIFHAIFILLLTATNFYLFKKKDYLLLFIMTILALHGIIDDLIIYLYYNTFWLVIGKMIIKTPVNQKELHA